MNKKKVNMQVIEQQNKEKKLKIYKIFYDDEVISKCTEYEIIFSEKDPYPYYNRLANYTANDSSTNYISKVVKSVEKYFNDNLDKIDGLFIKLDIEAIIISAVLTKLNEKNKKMNIKYPLYESVFLCNNKYYQRTKEINPIKYSYIDIDNENVDLNNLLKFPFFLKAPELQMSVHQYVITDFKQLKQIIEQLKINLPNYNVDTKYLNQYYLNLDKYPLSIKNIMICEEFIKNCFQLNWEGWADNQGNIYTYGFTDKILADQGIFSDFIMPSKFPYIVLEKVENICKEFLKNISFKNSFVNIELWINKINNNIIHIIEVNPRSAFSYDNQYKTSFYGANLYDSIIKLSMGYKNIGIIPNINENFTGSYSCQSVFATRFNGKICELLNLEKIQEEKNLNKNYEFFFLFNDFNFEIIDNYQNGGRVLMRVFFTKKTYDEALNESIRLKKLFLIKDTYYINQNLND